MSKTETLTGAMTGIALATAASWARYDQETQRRLRNAREDAEEALDLVRDLQGRADVGRGRLPTVMDAQVGLALASPQPAAPAMLPSTTPLSRPDLSSQMETAVAEMSWPPEAGQYDPRGLVKQAGELTATFLALTYEEVRAFLQGLPQSRPPSREAKLQIFHAAQSLISTLSALHLSAAQYQQAWARLFGSEPQAGNASNPDPHQDPNRAPLVLGPLGPNVQSVVPLTSYRSTELDASPNTDAAMRFRIQVSPSGSVAAQIQVAHVRFGTEYRTRGLDGTLLPIQPVVLVQSRQDSFYADKVTSTGFTLFSNRMLGASDSIDAMIAVVPGLPTAW